MISKDYYNILGVEKESTDKEIKKSYRKLSKKYHPDVNPDKPDAEEKFKEIADAYSILSNKEKRENYDMYGNPDGQPNPFGGGSGINMDDVLSSFFGNANPFGGRQQRKRQVKGSDIRINIKLTLNDIFDGVHKNIKYKRKESCNNCRGSGGKSSRCVKCGGHGILTQIQNTPLGRMQNTVTCNSCGGNGLILVNPCKVCKGSGNSTIEEMLEFDVPKGIMDGEIMVIKGKGNFIKGGLNGDLLVNITEIPHEKFKRNGLDIHQRINLGYKDLVLGTPTEIETLNGKIRINIKSGTQVGHILRVPNKGIKRGNQNGDMLIEIWLDIPKDVKNGDKTLIEQL
jgi:molecular chaperone DnaJ